MKGLRFSHNLIFINLLGSIMLETCVTMDFYFRESTAVYLLLKDKPNEGLGRVVRQSILGSLAAGSVPSPHLLVGPAVLAQFQRRRLLTHVHAVRFACYRLKCSG